MLHPEVRTKMPAATQYAILAGRRARSEQQFIRIGNEVEESLEIGFILPLVQLVIEGAFFGIGLILFFLLDQQFSRKDFAAKIPIVESGVVDPFIEDLQLGNREFGRQQLEEDGVESGLIAQLFFSHFHHFLMIEYELRRLF